MEYVFGGAFVCDQLQDAKKVTFDDKVLTRSVSLAGDVFDPSGTLTGGNYYGVGCWSLDYMYFCLSFPIMLDMHSRAVDE